MKLIITVVWLFLVYLLFQKENRGAAIQDLAAIILTVLYLMAMLVEVK